MTKIDQSWYVRSPGTPVKIGAGGVVVRLEGTRFLVALVKQRGRSGYLLPKGKAKKNETLEEAARREVREEAGFTQLITRKYLGTCERLDLKKKNWKIVHYFLFETKEQMPAPADPHGRYTVDWFVFTELPAMLWPEQRQLIERIAREIAKAAMEKVQKPGGSR